MNKFFKTWLVPIIISTGIFFAVRPAIAQITQIPLTTDVEVGQKVSDGFLKIYYLSDGQEIFVSQQGLNSQHPDSEGEYITWSTEINGQGQIFLYNLTSNSTIQLTSSGTNLRPKVSKEGRVVWEGWVNDRWQIFLFDGVRALQLTSGDISINPDIEGNLVIFARQDETGSWRSVLYSLVDETFTDVSIGAENEHPLLDGGRILYKYPSKSGQTEFPLTASDLELLNLEPLSRPEVVTEEEIVQELEAMPSAEVVEPGTVSPTSSPGPGVQIPSEESSSSGQLEGQ